MTVRLAINGMGRIGRMVLRGWIETGRDDVEIVAINSPGPVKQSAYLMGYDSVHGRMAAPVQVCGENRLVIGEHQIAYSSIREPARIDWAGHSVDVVLECSGKFNSMEGACAHLTAGAGKVLISAPAKNVDRTVVWGVNGDQIKGQDRVISNASCTTNALAPIVTILDRCFGFEHGFMTTIHAFTNDQHNLDNSHRDPRRGRACGLSMIPTTTGAARSIGLVLPHLAGKLDGISIRVPVPNVSMIDLVAHLRDRATVELINQHLADVASGSMAGIMGFSGAPLVSVDFNHRPESVIIDATQTAMVEGQMVRIGAWYDNEWGFALRMLDVAQRMGTS